MRKESKSREEGREKGWGRSQERREKEEEEEEGRCVGGKEGEGK